MPAGRPIRTLIAAPSPVVQTLSNALGELGVEVRPGTSVSEAEGHLATRFDLILVCYVFDDVHPYRFVGRIRGEGANAYTPVILVRALPVPLGESQEWEIRRAYQSIGVDEFVNYSQLVHDQGEGPANQALRQCVLRVLRPRSAARA